jgi:hypothetical protein
MSRYCVRQIGLAAFVFMFAMQPAHGDQPIPPGSQSEKSCGGAYETNENDRSVTEVVVQDQGVFIVQSASHVIEAIVASYFDALLSGDVSRVEQLLAPEFQILRIGGGYSRKEFLTQGLPSVHGQSNITVIEATTAQNIIVARILLEADEVIEGRKVERCSGQLLTLREVEGIWKFSAVANFALPAAGHD